tara:strand:+ start:272 stop:892 length:621 start_codon:yes stop_codon:yes gene_type:complete
MKRILLAAAAAAALAVSAVAPGAPAWAQDVETSQSGVLLGIQTEGSPDAPVHVIEYVSLTCPHCAAFQADVFPQLKKDFIDTGKITYEVREAYFDRFGLMAAIVARCGGEERYFGFIDLFLTRQSRWARADDIPAELAKMGRQGGLTEEQVNACLADTDAQRALVGMYQEYREDPRFTGTPTLIVGDEKVENPSYENLAAAIEAEM